MYEEGSNKSKDADFGGTRTLKKCHLASLKAHNLCSAADIFSPGNLVFYYLSNKRLFHSFFCTYILVLILGCCKNLANGLLFDKMTDE